MKQSLMGLFLTLSLVLPFSGAYALSFQENADAQLKSLYSSPMWSSKMVQHSTVPRVIYFSKIFLAQKSPYILDPLGEGEQGLFSKNPLYRFDGFDCTTFVETVLALARSENAEAFRTSMNQIRYKEGRISYETRNHFPSLDWIPNNTRAGVVKDITGVIAGENTKWAQTWIDKGAWYRKKGEAYSALSKLFSPELAQLPYISKDDLLNRPALVDRIPSGSIFHVVRMNWDAAAEAAGTPLDVSHMGFLVREQGVLYMIHASNGVARDGSDNFMGVKKEALVSYIQRVMVGKSSMVGFNILAVQNK